MHLYAHRRFHEAKPGKCPVCGQSHWLWWLEVTTKIIKLIVANRQLIKKEVKNETRRDT